MEIVIAKLLEDFEHGKMNRRQLIQSLSLAAAATAAMASPARAAGKPLEALYVNHISYEVNDYKKVRDFYVDLLGMKVTEDDGKQCRLVFGNNMLIPRNRAGGGPAKVDHIAYTVTNWDAEKDGLEEELKRRGLQYRGSAKTSFHIKDPEGMGVQFGGLHQ
jgi:catechol 2,3-dioxygenase-like lactoylglutathione lyase family enzyme